MTKSTFHFLRRVLPRPLVAGVVVSSGLIGGCSEVTVPQRTGWEAELQPLPPAQVRGSVAVLSQSGRSETSIVITDAQSGATYAWRIRSGSCQEGGAVVGGLAVYPLLSPDTSGDAEGQTTLSRELDAEGVYAAWVLQLPEAGAEELVACGELSRLL